MTRTRTRLAALLLAPALALAGCSGDGGGGSGGGGDGDAVELDADYVGTAVLPGSGLATDLPGDDGPVLTMPTLAVRVSEAAAGGSLDVTDLEEVDVEVPEGGEVEVPEGRVLVRFRLGAGAGPYPDLDGGPATVAITADGEEPRPLEVEAGDHTDVWAVVPETGARLAVTDQGRTASFDLPSGQPSADQQTRQVVSGDGGTALGAGTVERDSTGAAVATSPVIASAFGESEVSVSFTLDLAASARLPFTPQAGWARPGRAWLVLAVPSFASLPPWGTPGLQLRPRDITFTPAGAAPVRARGGLVIDPLADVDPPTVVFPVPTDAARGTLRLDVGAGTVPGSTFTRVPRPITVPVRLPAA